jgi:hypothetical protein
MYEIGRQTDEGRGKLSRDGSTVIVYVDGVLIWAFNCKPDYLGPA